MDIAERYQKGRKSGPKTDTGVREKAQAAAWVAKDESGWKRMDKELSAITKKDLMEKARIFADKTGIKVPRLAMRRRDFLICFFRDNPTAVDYALTSDLPVDIPAIDLQTAQDALGDEAAALEEPFGPEIDPECPCDEDEFELLMCAFGEPDWV
jgi:hypothetical protein